MSIGVLSDELENDNDEREHNTIDAEWTERVLFAEVFHHEMAVIYSRELLEIRDFTITPSMIGILARKE